MDGVTREILAPIHRSSRVHTIFKAKNKAEEELSPHPELVGKKKVGFDPYFSLGIDTSESLRFRFSFDPPYPSGGVSV
jgi:hypothetical protein